MYNKLFTKILDSSIWMEPLATRIVWVTLIAAMDEDGFVAFASPSNVAHRARVTDDEAREAIATLEGPDPNSSNPDNEGRRIERVPGGWIVINAPIYRDLVTREIIKKQTRERVQRYRQKAKGNASVTGCNASVTKGNDFVTPSDTATATTTKTGRFSPPSFDEAMLEGSKQGLPRAEVEKFMAYYESNGWKVGKNSMKNWRPAMVGWRTRWEQNGRPGITGQTLSPGGQTMSKAEMLKEAMR